MSDEIEEEEKRIYFTISMYNLRRILEVPKIIRDIIWYMRVMKPEKYDYSKFDDWLESIKTLDILGF